jgi:hypothetical protein
MPPPDAPEVNVPGAADGRSEFDRDFAKFETH